MKLGVVLPCLNEGDALGATLSALRPHLAPGEPIVVADGGSDDDTQALARDLGAVVVEADAGRGPQLNAGARVARQHGVDVLLFLHADSRLGDGARRAIAGALRNGAPGGGFLVRFDGAPPLLRFGERLVNARSRWLRVPLGDQGQFARVSAFERVGGFPDWPILEDLEFLRRLRRQGRLAILEPPVQTSARRFVQRGVVRTVCTNWLIWSLYALGADPHRLARLYRHAR